MWGCGEVRTHKQIWGDTLSYVLHIGPQTDEAGPVKPRSSPAGCQWSCCREKNKLVQFFLSQNNNPLFSMNKSRTYRSPWKNKEFARICHPIHMFSLILNYTSESTTDSSVLRFTLTESQHVLSVYITFILIKEHSQEVWHYLCYHPFILYWLHPLLIFPRFCPWLKSG